MFKNKVTLRAGGVILKTMALTITYHILFFPYSYADEVKSTKICERLKGKLQESHDKYGFPGAVIGAVLNDGSECNYAVGLGNIKNNISMKNNDRLLTASVGKTFVAAAVINLHFKENLDIDDPISKWVSDRPFYSKLANNSKITIRHLLSHTSGIGNHINNVDFHKASKDLMNTDIILDPNSLVDFVADDPPLFKLGEGFAYTDTGYIILGLIIEKASGQSFYSYVDDQFLKPFALTSIEPANKRYLEGLIQGYAFSGSDTKKQYSPDDDSIETMQDDKGLLRFNPGTEWTGGGFVANAFDLSRWIKIYLSGQAMSFDYLDLIFNGSPYIPEKGESPYGLGVGLYQVPLGKMVGHSGWFPGYRSVAFYFPEKGISYSLQINTDVNMTGEKSKFIDLNLLLQEAFADQDLNQ